MPYLVCYDIEDNYLRTKVGSKLIEEGFDRIQYSVFLGNPSETALAHLTAWFKLKLEKENVEKDKLLIVSVPQQQLESMVQIGKAAIDIEEISGNKSTLFF